MRTQASPESEVVEAFEAYERALADNDVATMDGYFWDSEQTVRFGVAEEQWGARQLREWRRGALPVPPGRSLTDTRVAMFGPATAVVTTLFRYPEGGEVGRQSQTWIRFDEGWRIVSAHVSQRPVRR